MRARLAGALVAVADAVPPEAKDWWIIGSSAMALCGIEDVEPEDVDVLGSAATLSRLLKHWRVEPARPSPVTASAPIPMSGSGCPVASR